MVTVNIAAWQSYATQVADGEQRQTHPPARLEWCQRPGLGPGAEILGPLHGRRVLDLGCGPGNASAYLTSRGAIITGIDAAATQIRRARTRWGHLPIEFVQAEATSYLRRPGPTFDLIISIFGALDWTPPQRLLPLISARLSVGGRLAFSSIHPHWHDRINLQLSLPSGGSLPVVRSSIEPAVWPQLLVQAALHLRNLQEIIEPGGEVPRCLIVTASRPQPEPSADTDRL